MKTMTVVLTEEEAERVEAIARDRGLSPDKLLHDAVVAYVEPIPSLAPDTSNPLPFIGIGASGYTDTASRMDEILAEE